ncbi:MULTISPECIES: bifunctional UDP-N-acetylglucosamine diphosphorylase/glucosamine-1-phosphate N-acetyltransferase GlmU [Acinetobacter]|jgi:bifunctional UDP-N-acetylglucosamine pyrophosphorylase/glucosamine-1-phosphate N-acetyltransferase|uniref:bifunctional UDP-N-acetylglucosamine diphosphorylase/glucosamine-1-phosphate N-acetyltransferase GlmU n=1 Tax=Acinetobacter TaxID=469 RepID=UPI0015B77606|nr:MULTISPECIES: bifunctional UDP-N-acetylglucosamine diphosphorylase/glucosamine-1-phosphate N-acetyltransferase GlmU [Acinetobacter]MBT0887140.1 bifunctional UDP-N-acetylglucosamine diphosphorylase/glucosamine-1-phosphate N-acetyltransferase GlmU [Acinetobacter towneri]NWJ92547.1 bifunctional UDP-N-acetylglucosamine diphosphorylase/glucosamine-1-phosphate N-acetyltransferase GlmU [Acinetobacter sp. Swhac1]UIP25308.1 bifunctional UDP-N-acetylglucosamine diphosphorylase/glucosamine-1-phosphate N
MSTTVIILAAGKGTRMRSNLPKVLQPLAGRPLLGHVIDTAKKLQADHIITIYGHGGTLVQNAFAHEQVQWVEQAEQLGTGHAVKVTLPVLPHEGVSLILSGDVPCITEQTLQKLLDVSRETQIGLVTLTLADATGYGRIVRENGKIQAIVEHKDASEAQRQIQEINTGIYCVSNAKLHEWLPKLSNNNAQGEYYLTDIVAMAIADGLEVASVEPALAFEVEGVNDRVQLAALEREFQNFQAKQLMQQGVHLIDPTRFDLRGNLTAGKDVRIDINVIIEGDCELGDGVEIGAGCILKNTKIAAGTKVQPYSVFDQAVVGEAAQIGPFSRLRPGAVLANEVHIGNFVEVKNSQIGLGSKANHFTYLGDAEVGAGSNIGAGTITCNYDGANKFKTIIGDQVFIGSNSSLVAPVTIANGATVGAGSTITRDVAEQCLAVERSKQFTKENYQRPQKLKK